MNPMQMLQGMRNPQQFLQQMMVDRQMMSNPIIKNALGMAQNGDSKGIEQMARNLCKEKGIDADKAFESFKSQLGM